MSQDQKAVPQPTDPQVISDFKGTPAQQRQGKVDYIAKFGYEQWEQLTVRSRKDYQR
jgi:hypothetical protein